MNTFYNKFREHKKMLNELKKKEFSERTLKYFGMLAEMLEREADYGSSFPFLESVYNYIEENEFITDKQCEIVDRIADHPEMSFGGSPEGEYGSQF